MLRMIRRLPVLLLLAGTACNSEQTKLANLMANPSNGLIQVKKNNAKTIVMELLPGRGLPDSGRSAGHDLYSVKLALRTNEKIKGAAAMQYMNFGIKNSFYAVQGGDTLPCVICERIPGVSENEYVYMTFFNKPAAEPGVTGDLRLLVADTVAGFGVTAFIIKNEVIKKLEAIKKQ